MFSHLATRGCFLHLVQEQSRSLRYQGITDMQHYSYHNIQLRDTCLDYIVVSDCTVCGNQTKEGMSCDTFLKCGVELKG
ncbi:hypothetical protein J6590_042099 [Homalodisca vitripennis]|nr:hypothetical protein J6590_088052 [Homalodisca vitripennis]KAG8336580.1 hypothetical protein J6590_042099 [Homalodisca vitripennis]